MTEQTGRPSREDPDAGATTDTETPREKLGQMEDEARREAQLAAMRLRHQAAQDPLSEETANRIDPDKLNELQRQVLKESFRVARKLQQRLALDYQL